MKIAACIITHNDLAMLRCALPYIRRWADFVCIADEGSTDGTRDYLEANLAGEDRLVIKPTNEVPLIGFGRANNELLDLADRADWIMRLDADYIPDWNQSAMIREFLGSTEALALWVELVNFTQTDPPLGELQWETLAKQPVSHREKQIRVFRTKQAFHYRGYIHTELHHGNDYAVKVAQESPIRCFHFGNMRSPAQQRLHQMRASWMLKNALANPELQAYTNTWWYDTYYPERKDEVDLWAKAYAEEVLRP